MFLYRAGDRSQCVSLCYFVIALGYAQEAGRRTVAAPIFVSVVLRAVEVVK